jgi:hypothetical protein
MANLALVNPNKKKRARTVGVSSPVPDVVVVAAAADDNWQLWLSVEPQVPSPDILSLVQEHARRTERAKEYAIAYNTAVASLGHVITTEEDYPPGKVTCVGWKKLFPFVRQRPVIVDSAEDHVRDRIVRAKKMATFINTFPARIRHIL